MVRKASIGLVVGVMLVVGGAATTLGLSGSGRADPSGASALHYLQKRYALERSIDRAMPLIVVDAERVGRSMNNQCGGDMEDAPRTATFGVLDSEVLWAPRVVMWRAREGLVTQFARVTERARLSDESAAKLANAISREETAKAKLPLRDGCADIVAWRSSRYMMPQPGAKAYLQRIAATLSIGDLALEGLPRQGGELEKCVQMKSGKTICSERRETQGKGSKVKNNSTAQGALLKLLAATGGRRGKVLAVKIAEVEREIAQSEEAAWLRTARRMTRVIGLDPAVLQLMRPS